MSDLEQDAVLDEQQTNGDVTDNEQQEDGVVFEAVTDDNVEPQDTQDEEADSVEEQDDDGDTEGDADGALDEDLLRQSEQLGISADGVSSNAELQRLVNAVNRRFIQTQPQSQPQQPQQQQQQPTQPQPQVPADDNDIEFQLPEDVDEEIAAPIKQVVEYANKRVARAEQRASDLSNSINQVTNILAAMQLDSYVNTLGEEYESTFGKGGFGDLNQEHYENRQKLMTAANALNNAYQQQNIQVNPSEIFRRVLSSEFSTVGKQATNKRLQEKQTNRRRTTTNKPNRRAGKPQVTASKKPKNDVDAAIAFADQWLKENQS